VTAVVQRPGPLPAVDPDDPGRPGRTGQSRRLPVTWPLVTLFVMFPLWWVLGLSALIWPVLAAPMLVALIWRRRTRAPLPFFLWLLFCSWVLMSGLQLGSGTKLVTFSYRLLLYAGAGVLFLYVYNMPRSGRIDVKVLRILTTFWMIVVAGGYVGIIGGAHTFPSVIEFVIPHGLRSQPFVQELVQPVFANVVNFLGFPDPRPSAPFPYTNNWGGNVAVLTPVALAALSATRPGGRRKLIIFFLIASLLPMVVSLNRGMFLSIGVGLVYVAIRFAGRGRVTSLVSLLGLVALAGLLVAFTPLSHIVTANLSSTHGHSNTTRVSVVQQAVDGANRSPLFGYGEPQAVTGQGGTPPIGSQGQLWMNLYSNGYVATALFLAFFVAVLWQTRKARGTAGLWLHAVPLVALAQITVYGWLPIELQVVMVIAALAYRRCMAPNEPDALRIASAPDDQLFLPARAPGPTRAIYADDRPIPATAAGQKKAPAGAAAILLRGSVINVVAMVAGAAMSFGLVVLVSRWLQPRGAGAFFELIALFTILSNTFELGADTGLIRWISRAKATGGLSDVRRVVVAAIVPVAVVGIAAAVAVWLTAPQLAGLFLHGVPAHEGILAIRIVAPLVPVGALSSCLTDGARGFGRMWPYLLIEGAGKPAMRIAAVVAVLAAGFGLSAAVLAWGLPVLVGLAAAPQGGARQAGICRTSRGCGCVELAGRPGVLGLYRTTCLPGYVPDRHHLAGHPDRGRDRLQLCRRRIQRGQQARHRRDVHARGQPAGDRPSAQRPAGPRATGSGGETFPAQHPVADAGVLAAVPHFHNLPHDGARHLRTALHRGRVSPGRAVAGHADQPRHWQCHGGPADGRPEYLECDQRGRGVDGQHRLEPGADSADGHPRRGHRLGGQHRGGQPDRHG
jgi:polysaccharide biosynthesis protein PslJ